MSDDQKLITYAYHGREGKVSFHYDVVDDVIEWIRDAQEHKDGPYVLVNVLDISKEHANEFDGVLKSM